MAAIPCPVFDPETLTVVDNPVAATGTVHEDGTIDAPSHLRIVSPRIDPPTVVVLCHSPLVVYYPMFASSEECDYLIAKGAPRLHRSATGKGGTDKEVGGARTSSSGWFKKSECPIIRRVEARSAHITGFPIDCIEPLQIVHYSPGEYYKPHWDSYNEKYAQARRAKAAGYERVSTILLYLNDVEECRGTTPSCVGGLNACTIFVLQGVAVPPRKGSAVFWVNTDASLRQFDGALHQGAPVCCGEKWAANIWVHSRSLRGYQQFEAENAAIDAAPPS